MNEKIVLIEKMGEFIAGMPPTVTRGQGKGTHKAATTFLRGNAKTILREISDSKTFVCRLDAKTEELAAALPGGSWGAARKCLNIFLREALYNFYLRREYELNGIESFLEVPLDSFVAHGLRKAKPSLPRWASIKSLTSEVNAAFQAAATGVADECGIARVHLDVFYWRATT